jgi:hypothetical protein
LSHFNKNPFSENLPPLFRYFPILLLDLTRDETTSVNHCITDSLARKEEKKTTFIGNKEGDKLSCQDLLISLQLIHFTQKKWNREQLPLNER